MGLFFDDEVFSTKIVYRGEKCSVVAQIYVQIEEIAIPMVLIKKGEGSKVLDTDWFALMQVDVSKRVFVPIYNRYVDRIVSVMEKIPDRRYILNGAFNSIGNKEGNAVKLNSRLYVAATNHHDKNTGCDITVRFGDADLIPTKLFCCVAYDGIDKRILFEIDSEAIKERKEYHLLDGISVCQNSNLIDNFHAYFINYKEGESTFFCYSEFYLKSKNKQASYIKFENLNIYENLEFVFGISGFSNIKLEYPQNQQVLYSWYTVMMSVQNLSIEANFGVGNVRFMKSDSIENAQFKEKVYKLKQEGQAVTFAMIHINAKSFFDAFELARMQIQQSLDFVVNLSRDDSLFSGHGVFDVFVQRQISDLEAMPVLDDWVSIEIPYYEKRVLFNRNVRGHVSELNIRAELIDQLKQYEKIELDLIASIQDEESQVIPLFNSLKWLRKAWDSVDPEDKIIYLVIALEFVVGDEKSVPLFSKTQRKQLKTCLKEKLLEIDGERPDFEEYFEKVRNGFDNQFTNSPFMVKLVGLIARLNIPVTENDLSLITSARTSRNDVVHGRVGSFMSSDEIRKLCEIVSQIVFYKMRELEVNHT